MPDSLPNTLADWLGYAVLWGSAIRVLAPPILLWISESLVNGTEALMALSTRIAATHRRDLYESELVCQDCGRLLKSPLLR